MGSVLCIHSHHSEGYNKLDLLPHQMLKDAIQEKTVGLKLKGEKGENN